MITDVEKRELIEQLRDNSPNTTFTANCMMKNSAAAAIEETLWKPIDDMPDGIDTAAVDNFNAYLEMVEIVNDLRAQLATARNDALEDAARQFEDWAKSNDDGVEYSDLVGVPISNRNELLESAADARRTAKLIREMKENVK